MDTYNVDSKKRKHALKQVVKANVKQTKGFPKFCYWLTIFLRILAVVLGILNILYVVFLSNYFVDILFLIMTFGFPYALSFMSAIVYIISCGGEFRLRRREAITIANAGFMYSYHDDRVGLSDKVFGFNIPYEKIQQFEYEKATKLLTIYGDIIGDTYENGELKSTDEFKQISFLNVFEIDINDLLIKNVRGGNA